MLSWTVHCGSRYPLTALAVVVGLAAGCAAPPSAGSVGLEAVPGTCEVLIDGPPGIGRMRLWVPEGIMSETGACAVYPVGGEWVREGATLRQVVRPEGNFGPGNFVPVGEGMLECAGIRMPRDSAVSWHTGVTARSDGVDFAIRLTNAGDRPIRKAAAAICLKFAAAPWWCDAATFVRSGGQVRSLAELGRDAGPDNGFEAYLLTGTSFNHPFYEGFWGFNRHRLDTPVMVSEHREAGLCVAISGPRAYFLHSNRGNPCTDIMLAFGDLAPGTTAEARGRVSITRADARAALDAGDRW